MICVQMRHEYMNVEQAREVFQATSESLFAMTDKLQMPHTTVFQAMKVS